MKQTTLQEKKLLVRAMTTMECGIPYEKVDVETIREGVDLAFPGKRKVKKKWLVSTTSVNIGESQHTDRKETDYKYWDEYRDW